MDDVTPPSLFSAFVRAGRFFMGFNGLYWILFVFWRSTRFFLLDGSEQCECHAGGGGIKRKSRDWTRDSEQQCICQWWTTCWAHRPSSRNTDVLSVPPRPSSASSRPLLAQKIGKKFLRGTKKTPIDTEKRPTIRDGVAPLSAPRQAEHEKIRQDRANNNRAEIPTYQIMGSRCSTDKWLECMQRLSR